MPIMTLEEIAACARELGLPQPEAIAGLARIAVLLEEKDAAEEEARGSRLGGRPFLPPDIDWPKGDRGSLSFVAQIDLTSLPAAAAGEDLPREGLLLFFYDAETETWGCRLDDAGNFAVIHLADPGTAVLADWPDDLPTYARYKPCHLAPAAAMTLPPWDSALVEAFDIEDGGDAYNELEQRVKHRHPVNEWARLGGHPAQIQNDMSFECAKVAAGLTFEEGPTHYLPHRAELTKQARDWRLLAQIDGSDGAGMTWGDVGADESITSPGAAGIRWGGGGSGGG